MYGWAPHFWPGALSIGPRPPHFQKRDYIPVDKYLSSSELYCVMWISWRCSPKKICSEKSSFPDISQSAYIIKIMQISCFLNIRFCPRVEIRHTHVWNGNMSWPWKPMRFVGQNLNCIRVVQNGFWNSHRQLLQNLVNYLAFDGVLDIHKSYCCF